MDANDIPPTFTATSHREQQVSGISVFWALASLSLNAMIQPSSCGHIFSGNAFNAALWPHRSSPFLCLIDAIADVWIIMDKHQNLDRYRQKGPTHTGSSGSTVMLMKLVLFVVGVLPQAIKLFSIRGIPLSQAMGAMLLASIMSNMLRTLTTDVPLDDLATFMKPLAAGGKRNLERGTFVLLCCLAVLPHAAILYKTWYEIGQIIDLGVPEPTEQVFIFVAFGLNVVWAVHAVQHTLSIVSRGKWTLPRMPLLVMIGALNAPNFPRLLLMSASGRRLQIQPSTWTLMLMCHVGLCCFGLSWLLFAAVKMSAKFSTAHRGTAVTAESGTSFDAPQDYGEHTGRDTVQPSDQTSPDAMGDLGLATLSHQASLPSGMPTSREMASQQESEIQPLDPPSSNERAPTSETDLEASALEFSSLFTLSDFFENSSTSRHQQEAEEGTCTVQQHDEAPAPQGKPLPLPIRFVVHITLLLVWRLIVSFMSLYIYSWNWMLGHLRRGQNVDITWTAFGVLNAVTVATYYAVIFDGEGTRAPRWAELLG